MSTPFEPSPDPTSRFARVVGKLLLALLGLAIGAIAGVMIAGSLGWFGPFSC